MLLSEMTYELLEIIRNAHVVDDEEIDRRLLAQFIRIQRSFWLSNSMDKSQMINDSNMQEYIVDMDVVDSSFDSSLPSGDKILRSVNAIPDMIGSKFGEAITSIDSPDVLNPNFSVVSISRLPWVGSGRFNTNSIFVAYHQNRIYATYGKLALTDLSLKKVRIKALLEDPEDVPGFDVETNDYPISGKIWALIKDSVMTKDLRELVSHPQDKVNDGDGTEIR